MVTTRKPISVAALVAIAAALLALPTTAFAGETGWALRVSGAWLDPDFAFRVVEEGEEIRLDVDSEIGVALDLEYRFSNRLGVTVGVTWVELGAPLTVTVPDVITIRLDDDLRFMPITAGLNVHLTPSSAVDLYIAPMVAWVRYGDLEYELEGAGRLAVEIDDDLAWGGLVGVDVPIGEQGWMATGAVSYLVTDLDGTDRSEGGRQSFDFDTLAIRLGVGYRF